MTTTILRPYEADDLEAVKALWLACDLTRPWNDPDKDIQRKLAVDPHWFIVGVNNEEIVASIMIGYEGHRGWVNYLAVKPALQGSGLGRQLMQRAEQELLQVGCPKLNLQVRETNQQVLDFYNAIGYKVDAAVSLGKRLIPDD